MDVGRIRKDFPLLSSADIIYFDSACTSLKPMQVIDAEASYYLKVSACAGRSPHQLAKKAGQMFEESRSKIAGFVGAKPEELVFTKNATEALNLVVRCLSYKERKKIVTTPIEHHSLLLPILEAKRRGVAEVEYLDLSKEGKLVEESLYEKIGRDTALVATNLVSNITGLRMPVEKIAKAAKEAGAMVLIDAAQGVPHLPVNFKRLGADFLAFSGHKMCGPTGIGCLIGKADALEGLDLFLVGGETVDYVSLESVKWKSAPHKFEGGIQNYAGAIGLAAACDYLSKIGMANIEEYGKALASLLFKSIRETSNAVIYGSQSPPLCPTVSFNIKGIPPSQVALMADSLSKVALRSGVFCAQPGMALLGAPAEGAVRASLYFYNTKEEIKVFSEALAKISLLSK